MKLVAGKQYMRNRVSGTIYPYHEQMARGNVEVFVHEEVGATNDHGKNASEGSVSADAGPAEEPRVQPVDDLGPPVVLKRRAGRPLQLSS